MKLHYLTFPFCFSACIEKEASDNHVEKVGDSVYVNSDKAIIDSLFPTRNLHYKNLILRNSGIKGNVKSISLTYDWNGLYFPFDYVEFNEDGTIRNFERDNEPLERQRVKVDNNNNVITVEFGDTICGPIMTFDIDKRTFEYDSDEYSIKYIFEYSPNGKLARIVKEEVYRNYDLFKWVTTKEVFKVTITSRDSKGNWTSIALKSRRSILKLTRDIQYF